MLKSLTLTVLIRMAPKTVNRAKGDDGSSTIHEKVRSDDGGSSSPVLISLKHTVWPCGCA